ncbi:MAG TPA: hypothetical protein VFC93_01345 [Chloroflexota bacterium]|nr:hypothetical protein [Chloroflexota bacterium]
MAKIATRGKPRSSPPTGELRPDEEAARAADPAALPLPEKPRQAPGGIAGRASRKERRDPVVRDSDESFPASDPPARY